MRYLNLYGISGLHQYVDAENFGLILDNVNAKYNRAIWRQFASWGKPTDDREWKQGIKKTPILVRASILGTHSEKPQRSTLGWEFYGGTLPQLGHGFNITQDDMIELRKSAKLADVTFGEALTDSFVLNSDAMIGGVHNELSYMVMQAMSTGEIHDIAVDGARYDFKFQIPDENFLEPVQDWYVWENQGTNEAPKWVLVPNENADVIEDIVTFQKYLKDTLSLGVDHWKLSKDLLDKIVLHPSVKNAYLASKNLNSESWSHYKIVRTELLSWMHDDMKVWPFQEIDFQSRHEEDGKPVADAPAFDIHNMVAASRAYRPFEIKCMNSILKDRNKLGAHNDSVRTHFVEERIAVQNVWQDRPMMNIIDCELYAGPVFNNVRDYSIAKVWKDRA
jgi:hypothetical protein